ncbi:MAG: permease [Phycisphaerae bacterium]|nr:permease [Phycisphaerae bacterium]
MVETLGKIAIEFWGVLSEMAPYLLFGFFMAGVLSVLISGSLVERHLGGSGFFPVVKAAAFGVPLPLCSCGVIPVAASLRRGGASKGATTSFLMATPQDGVDSIMVTFSLLGPVFAIFRPVAALISGVIGGGLVSMLDRDDQVDTTNPKRSDDASCADNGRGKLYRALRYGFVALPGDIGKALLVGLVIAALISAIIPQDYFGNLLPPGWGQMIVMMLAGIPVYVCATASVPIAWALIAAGVSPGAALVFLMTGPATNAATLVTVWKVMGRRTAIIYLTTVGLSALAAGAVLDWVYRGMEIPAVGSSMWMLPHWAKLASAVGLLAILAVAIFRPMFTKRSTDAGEAPGMVRMMKVKGMTCSHCADTVRRALLGCPNVVSAEVDLRSGAVRVGGDDVDAEALGEAVRQVGYEIQDTGDTS